MESINENLAETLSRELKSPVEICSEIGFAVRRVALPAGWSMREFDDERLLSQPRRKVAKVSLADAKGFVEYVQAQASEDSTIWVDADFTVGKIKILAIINDHGPNGVGGGWRDHLAEYSPRFSEEWRRWTGFDRKPMAQSDFAGFIEENLQDVATVEGLPSGADMLRMAIDFEAKQDLRFKSALRLQSGGVDLVFVQQEDSGTLEKMKLFDRFAIGIPVFRGEDAFRVDARLRYRVHEGKLRFWYEIIRPDKTIEASANDIVAKIAAAGLPIFNGNPFA